MRQDLNETTASLSLEDFVKILDSSGFRHVALHGWGEPLLNAQLFDMIKYAESRGVSTELTTNATLLQPNIEKIFASGLSIIAFGIHNKENLPVVTPQIKELITQRNRRKLAKPKTYSDIVIYRGNQNHIAGLVEAIAGLNIDAVVLHRVFNIHPAGKPHSSLRAPLEFCDRADILDADVGYISIEEEKELFSKVKRLARTLKIKIDLPPEPSVPCRAVKYSVFVTSKGKVTPCPYLPEFYVGDALSGSIKEAAHSQRYRNFVKNMKEHPVCSKCPLGSTNGKFYS
ncbi:hypothetical protein ES703_18214 [subsurface metagenome]